MSVDNATVLAEIKSTLFPEGSKRWRDGNMDPDDGYGRHKRMLAYLAKILETNEDLLYGLFWELYNAYLSAPESERPYHKWFMQVFDGIVQKPTHRAICFAGGLLLNPQYPARDLAAEGLGRMGSLDAYNYLMAAVFNDDWQTVTRVVRALGEIKAVQAVPLLAAIVMGSAQSEQWVDNEIVQAYALDGLELMDTPTAWEAMESVALRANIDDELRGDAIDFLVSRQGKAVVPLLERLASDESPEVRDVAELFLKKLHGPA